MCTDEIILETDIAKLARSHRFNDLTFALLNHNVFVFINPNHYHGSNQSPILIKIGTHLCLKYKKDIFNYKENIVVFAKKNVYNLKLSIYAIDTPVSRTRLF